ncbi:glycosyltransferase family 2 protein [Pseudomonas oryzihabitans]|uniref:glycosyltransferase family 2 protein n=1 Tax=Pseudomonas oryzihabitans TaxID=47885 RepID=UPI003D0254A0
MTELSQAPALVTVQGQIQGLYGNVLEGWAFDPAQPDLRLALDVFIDGASVALVRADTFQHDPLAGDGFHGFAVQLQPAWLSGARRIAVRLANEGSWIGEPLELPNEKPLKAEAQVPGSQVWYGGGLAVGGWVWDETTPGRYVEVRARLGNQIVARSRADLHHPVLIHRDDADHGYSLELPWQIGDGKRREVHIEDDRGRPLQGSPITVCCHAEGLGALVGTHWPEEADPAARDLLIRLAKEYDQRYPRSAGFGHYPEWFSHYQRAPQYPQAVANARIAVLLYGEVTDTERQACLDSLIKQRLRPITQAFADSCDVSTSLQLLVEEGIEAVLLQPLDSRLLPHALDQLTLALQPDGAGRRVAWAFGDCDQDGAEGQRSNPWFKPSWDLDLYLGADLFTAGALFGRDVIQLAVRLLNAAPELPRDHEGVLAALILATVQDNLDVARVTQVLSHRSARSPATPSGCDARKPERLDRLTWLVDKLRPGTRLSRQSKLPGALRTHWPLPERLPKVSLIIPTRDAYKLLHACMEGLLTQTDYPNLELIIVDNQTSDPKTLDYFDELKSRGVRILPYPYPFNYATLNNVGVEFATGEYIGLINNDIEILHPDWLKEMMSLAVRPDVGAVGAKLLWKNDMVQHAGVVIGINGLAAHTGNNWMRNDPGYLGFNHLVRRQSACTTACLIMQRDLYVRIDGMDEIRHPVAFNDVDMCLRINKLGLKILWTPFSELIHAESASRGKDTSIEKHMRSVREQELLREAWPTECSEDLFYSKSLNADWALGTYSGLKF